MYGSGGVTYQNGTTTVCPKAATTVCATLTIQAGEIKILTSKGTIFTFINGEISAYYYYDESGQFCATNVQIIGGQEP